VIVVSIIPLGEGFLFVAISSNSFIITSKPVSQEISLINKIENKNQIGNIQIPKNEHIPFTPVNLNVAINIDMNFSKSVKITIPKEDEVISLGENIRKLDEIKQKLVFDKIPKTEKINRQPRGQVARKTPCAQTGRGRTQAHATAQACAQTRTCAQSRGSARAQAHSCAGGRGTRAAPRGSSAASNPAPRAAHSVPATSRLTATPFRQSAMRWPWGIG
jgi:hypothetical protein